MTKFTAAKTATLAAMCIALGLGLAAQTNPAPSKTAGRQAGAPAPKPVLAVAHKPAVSAEPQPEITTQYCIGCHSEKGKAGG